MSSSRTSFQQFNFVGLVSSHSISIKSNCSINLDIRFKANRNKRVSNNAFTIFLENCSKCGSFFIKLLREVTLGDFTKGHMNKEISNSESLQGTPWGIFIRFKKYKSVFFLFLSFHILTVSPKN